jgi:hypothetical protein
MTIEIGKERKGKFRESVSASERHFKKIIEEKFGGCPEVAEKLLEMASCNQAGGKIVRNTFVNFYAIEIDNPELEINTKTKLIFFPDEKCFWLEIWKSGEVIDGETNIKVKRMELSEDKAHVVITRSDNGKKIHLRKGGRVATI